MAKTCYRQSKKPSFLWILGALDQTFEYVEEEGVDCFMSWDGVKLSHDGEPVTEALCDWIQEVIEYELWSNPYDFATTAEAQKLNRWNNKDRFDVVKYEKVKESIINRACEPVHSCVRAGLDMVTGNDGVLGFTIGDLKRMYKPDPIPDWIHIQFAGKLLDAKDSDGVML